LPPMLPNYFFTCPNCKKKIVVVFDWKNKAADDDPILEGLTCFKIGTPRGCGWEGSLPASQGCPLPERMQ